MYAVRLWSVRHAVLLNRVYRALENALVLTAPLWRLIGYKRLETPFAVTERVLKGFLFDCRMCGQCVLSSTGMSCPMNCPKTLRNGPCGGVRANGHCEVKPEMKCVWVQAWAGAARLGLAAENGPEAKIMDIQPVVDQRLRGKSSWLRVVQQKTEIPAAQNQNPKPAGNKTA